MGLPLEQWRGGAGEAAADGGKTQAVDASAPAGCRTPEAASRQAGRAVRDCPAAPRKRRAPPGVVSQQQQQQQQRRDFYSGDDIEAFFAAHNL